jgi:hypothetical protein
LNRALCALMLALAFPAPAAEPMPSAECDAERATVRIVMEPEMARLRPALYLEGDDRALDARQWTSGAVVARLYRPLPDGVYRIRLHHAGPAPRIIEVPLVVGVVGPAVVE